MHRGNRGAIEGAEFGFRMFCIDKDIHELQKNP